MAPLSPADVQRLYTQNPDGSYSVRAAQSSPSPSRLAKPLSRPYQPVPGKMNTTELWYATRILEPLKRAGTIRVYYYEALTFTLTHTTEQGTRTMKYTPDFLVEYVDHLELHEIKARKGDWTSARDDAIAKLKMARALYPQFGWKLVEIEDGNTHERRF